MKLILVITLLFVISLGSAQKNKKIEDELDNSRETEDPGREKRGFVLTHLSVVPTALLGQLEPYLRAVLPPHLLNAVAAFLPSAPLVAAPPNISPLLSATAPLTLNRALTTSGVYDPVLSPVIPGAVPSSPLVFTNQQLPQPVVENRRFVQSPPAFVNSQGIVTLPVASALGPTAARNVPSRLPPSPPVVPSPADFATARLAAATAIANNLVPVPTRAQGPSVVAGRVVLPTQRTSVPVLVSAPRGSEVLSTNIVQNPATNPNFLNSAQYVSNDNQFNELNFQRFSVLTQRL